MVPVIVVTVEVLEAYQVGEVVDAVEGSQPFVHGQVLGAQSW